jgi:hypothetical protein
MREKRYALKLTRGQLETLQRVLELSASDASDQQMRELEVIDSQIYGLLFPELAVQGQTPPKLRKPDCIAHPMPLRCLLRAVKD